MIWYAYGRGSEWFMGVSIMWRFTRERELYFIQVGALKGYEGANAKALALWQETYPNHSFVALTDTFSTEVFFRVCLPVLSLSSKP